MKQFLFFTIIGILVSCNNNFESKEDISVSHKDTNSIKIFTRNDTSKKLNISKTDSLFLGEFEDFKTYKLTDSLRADFNGDKISDVAYITQNIKKQIFIIDGHNKIKTEIGFDKSFGDMKGNFNWVDFWGITNDHLTYEIKVKDGEVVGESKTILQNPSIFVRKDEVGGGVITFKNGKYIWVHQAD